MLKHIPFYASLLERPEKPTIGMVLVYGAIEAHSFGEKGCIASNKTIAQETGLKEKTVANAISLLNKYRWVIVHLDNNNHRTLIEPSLTIEPPFTVQGTPLPATRNIEYSNKNTVIENDTNVSLAKADKYGKPEINDCFLKWKEIVGYPITSKTAANRNACNNLIRKHTVEGVERLIRGVAKTQEDKFAPRISDFITLQAKQNDLLAWGKRKLTGEVKGVIRV